MASSNITLSAGVRQNLLSLQNTAELMGKTQNRLATGKKVNSALDNPTNFFTAQSLQSRAGDMSALLDNMTSGIKTLEAADNGLSAITKTVESMQSTLRQARQDKSFKTESYTISSSATGNLSFSGGAVGSAPVSIALTTSVTTGGSPAENAVATATSALGSIDASGGDITFDINGETVTLADNGGSSSNGNYSAADIVSAINTQVGTSAGVNASLDSNGNLVITSTGTASASDEVAIDNFSTGTDATDLGFATASVTENGADAVAGTTTTQVKSVDTLVAEINNNTSLQGKVRASNDSGKLRIENLSTTELDVTGVTSGVLDGSGSSSEIAGNDVRANLVKQFNELRDQLDKLADDASYNGVNLLRGDMLKLTFNETGTSTIEIQAKDEAGDERPINSSTLGIETAQDADFDSDASIDAMLSGLSSALGTLRSQSSSFGSNLSIVENRTQFTKSMINTLQTGADSLVLADTNEEAANMLALQTRQQLSSTALSLASQADQAVLRLF